MTPTIAAAAGFLIAVLWFDLMFDVQVLPHRRAPEVPAPVLDSISAYYRRVTTTASPMGRLVALTMLILIGSLVVQAARDDVARWLTGVSLSAAVMAIGLAVVRVVGAAQRLGARIDTPDVQTRLARSIFRGHLVCLTAMVVLLAVQLVGA